MQAVNSQQLKDEFAELSTPLVADAIIRTGMGPRMIPSGIQSLISGARIAGRVIPVRHYGSVDVFFEALAQAQAGDILVIDNQGRMDEGCVGDLTALEAQVFGIAGVIVWGCHRDTSELLEIGLPIFSYGTCPFGPTRLEPREAEVFSTARFGSIEVELGDAVFADDDGVLFVPSGHVDELVSIAHKIRATERRQARAVVNGRTLREQLQFSEYLEKRERCPGYGFREHLRDIGGTIEVLESF